jgi:hypothetical protein
MLYGFLLLTFAFAAMVTSSLAYSERGWRYALAVTLLSAIPLVIWVAGLLRSAVRFFTGDIALPLALLLAALPFALVVAHLCSRRKNTPRHAPGPEDDPLYRRFRAEKLRRYRLRRQQEEQEEQQVNSTEPLGPNETPPSATSQSKL